MRLPVVLRYTGLVLLINSLFLLISAGVSLYYHDQAFFPLVYTAIISLLFGLFPLVFVPPAEEVSNNEGLLIVVASWLLSCIVGTIPYILWGGEFTITNAWFEVVSGFTTTGASILNNIEGLPKGILFWRASTHFIGGVGIIIFALSVLPSLGTTGMVLYRNEFSPAAQRHFKMRTKQSVRIILYVYLGITVAETLYLLACGLNLFDAVTHTFATVATGGFSTKNTSVAYFDSVAVETGIMFFMLISGMNFALLFMAVMGRFKEFAKSTVVKYYVGANLVAILIIAFNTWGANYNTFWEALRYSSFQVLSVGTSTGFANADSSVWPGFSQLLIIFFTLQCASAGSTSGGIKADRMVIMFKSLYRKIKQLRYPNAVFPLFVDKQKIKDADVDTANQYILFYVFIVFAASVIATSMGVDMLSAFSGAAAMMGNVGPGLSEVGAMENYSHLPAAVKWLFSVVMLLGRLEIYGFVIFFIPKTWK